MGHTYASADWHGCGDVANQIFEYLQPDDTLYFIGDAIDRGPAGIELFDKLITDPRVIYIKGNHEQLMETALTSIVKNGGRGDKFISDWFMNGGSKTWDSIQAKCKSDEEIMDYVRLTYHMPTEIIYTSPKGHSVILEHSGYSPFIVPYRSHDPLWDRQHFDDKWFGKYEVEGLDLETTYLVHGHTPVEYLKYDYGYYGQEDTKDAKFFTEKRAWRSGYECDIIEFCPKPEVIRYCDGHKFCIDMCTIATDRIALLDLDTFKIKYFDKESK